MSENKFDLDTLEYYILNTIFKDELYTRSFISKIQPNIFSPILDKIVKSVMAYYKKYSKVPSINLLKNQIIPKFCKDTELTLINEKIDIIENLEFNINEAREWLQEETKNFIKIRTVMNALMNCAPLIKQGKYEKIVSLMEEAFKINFDETFGLDYFDELEQRKERCKEKEEIISTGIKCLDNAIGGGLRRKTLCLFAGPANTGKTLCLNDVASSLAFNGYNVLYLSLELSEDYISQRTDAKFAEVPMSEINVNPEFAIKKAIARRDALKKENKKLGKLIYKEYSPNEICSNDIRGLLKNLEIKNDFKPDFVIVDYLRLVRPNGKTLSDNTYGRITTVCEELRSIGMLHNCCVLTASQTGRQSYNTNEIGMQDLSDSIGIAQTADIIITLLRPKEMESENIMILNVAKSRFSKQGQSMTVGVDYNFMRLVDLDDNETEIKKDTNTCSLHGLGTTKKSNNFNERKDNGEDLQELDI